NFHRPEHSSLQLALPIVPLEAAGVTLARSGPLLVEQLGSPSILPAFHRGLDQIHFGGIERFAQLFAGSENIVFLSIGGVSLLLGNLLTVLCCFRISDGFLFTSSRRAF